MRTVLWVATVIAFASFVAQAQLPADNVIVAFNNLAQEDIRTIGVQNQIADKTYALVHLAQYLAIKQSPRLPDIQKIGRAAYAGHAALNLLYPEFFYRHDAVLAPYANALTADQNAAAQTAGRNIAVSLVGAHLNDGLSNYVPFTPSPPGGPAGAYQFTPNQTYTLYPQLATTKTFVITDPASFDLGPPNALDSPAYIKDLDEVFWYGAKGSPNRTQYQTETPYFWADGPTTSTITGQINTIAQTVLSPSLGLDRIAEVFAQANVAAFDASVAGWLVKYKYLFWRPITAIRQGSGNPATAQYVKADWVPELSTPPHPEYASGHQYSAAGVAGVLINALGTDAVSFTIGTEYPNITARSFNSLSAAIQEVGDSRVLGGVHFRKSVDIGQRIGYNVADSVVKNWSKSTFGIPQPPKPPKPSPKPKQSPKPKHHSG